MTDNNRILDLLRKLKALADKGEGGEKENAKRMLYAAMEKHGISMEDIDDEHATGKWYKVPTDMVPLFFQVVRTVVRIKTYYSRKNERGKFRSIEIEVTPSQHVEIEAKFHFYAQAYKKEMERFKKEQKEREKLFFKAFIHRNDIFPESQPEEETEKPKSNPISPAELKKIIDMMDDMDQHHYLKQLNH
jgi:hypothetical protein